MNPFDDYGDFEMYTLSGNIAVGNALDEILRLSYDRTLVWNMETLQAAARPIIGVVAKQFGEVYDSEPRGHITDFLQRICQANGWTYTGDEYYSW